MSDFHGIIYAYGATKELGELVRSRTAASMPFCGRYRLIDFALSSMMNAGIHNVGVIMQRDYQSLLDHLGSGKDWDMGRKIGGLRMLPPFGLPEYHKGEYTGTVEALNAVSTYIDDIKEEHIVMLHGNTAANLDLREIARAHLASGAEITAICTRFEPDYRHHRYLVGDDGFASGIVFNQTEKGEGLASLEAYVISKKLLVRLMADCAAQNRYHFHRDALASYLEKGGRINVYVHEGYARRIMSTDTYFKTSMDMLSPEARAELFPADRPVRSKSAVDVSTYYGEGAKVHSSLVADGCIIEGELHNCIVSSDVRIEKGAKLHDCIIMRGSHIGENVILGNVIADKDVSLSASQTLMGSEKLPIVIPKGANI